MTATPDPEMQARAAAAAAAKIARLHIEWINEGDRSARIDGPIYRQIEGVAIAVVLDALAEQRRVDQAKLIAKVAPVERGT